MTEEPIVNNLRLKVDKMVPLDKEMKFIGE